MNLDQVLLAIEEEPELPGDPPQEVMDFMTEIIESGDINKLISLCRDAVVTTKEKIARRISARWHLEGFLPYNDIRRAFVEGASWWEWHQAGATMWTSDRILAENEAERRYPEGKLS